MKFELVKVSFTNIMTLPRFKRTYKLSLSFNIVLHSADKLILPATNNYKTELGKTTKKKKSETLYVTNTESRDKGKSKGHPTTGHEGPEGE